MFRLVFITAVMLMIGHQALAAVKWNNNKSQDENKVTIYNGWSIPQYVKPSPNLPTLKYYFKKDRDLFFDRELGHYRISPKGNHDDFKINALENEYLSKQMQTSSILSYLYMDRGMIKYEEKSPKQRLGGVYGDNTQYLSNSVGKSIVSYLVGHAICDGIIDSIDQKLNDWPLIKGTLYEGQSLIDLLNMNAGDAKYVSDADGLISSGRWYNTYSVKSFADRELKSSKAIPKSTRKHHYNGLVTNVILNYLVHKTDYEIQEFLNSVFQDKVKIQYEVSMRFNKFERTDGGQMTKIVMPIQDGTAQYTFYITRYDFLRVANAMLNDWKNDSCVGKYLKTLAKRKIPQKRYMEKNKGYRFSYKSYAGQFHLDYRGLENRNIFGMDGYGGQTLMIDFDKSRIIGISTVHTDYDFEGLVLNVMRNGKIKGKESAKIQ